MLKYVAQRKMDPCTEVNSIKNPCNNSLSKLTYKKTSSNTVEETTYNLYAVCCHHGNMQGGHYTGDFVNTFFLKFNSIVDCSILQKSSGQLLVFMR